MCGRCSPMATMLVVTGHPAACSTSLIDRFMSQETGMESDATAFTCVISPV